MGIGGWGAPLTTVKKAREAILDHPAGVPKKEVFGACSSQPPGAKKEIRSE
jgi:hypothetical protein